MVSQSTALFLLTGDQIPSYTVLPIPHELVNMDFLTLFAVLVSTYEGDLLAAAGVKFTVGRESRAKYNESLAGRRPLVSGACYGAQLYSLISNRKRLGMLGKV